MSGDQAAGPAWLPESVKGLSHPLTDGAQSLTPVQNGIHELLEQLRHKSREGTDVRVSDV